MKKGKIMNFFSDLGRSLMMPIAALAACGIVLGLTSALMKEQVLNVLPFLASGVPYFIVSTLNKVSNIVFTLLPVLFSMRLSVRYPRFSCKILSPWWKTTGRPGTGFPSAGRSSGWWSFWLCFTCYLWQRDLPLTS